MKYLFRHLLHVVCSISLFATSCEKAPDAPAAKAARAEVSISNYFNEDGAKNLKVWETRDIVAFVNATDVVTTQPLSTGSQTARFTFSTTASQGDKIAAYYPVSAGKYENGVINTILPAAQNGKISTFYVGNGAYSESEQTNVRISLNPLWCTVYAKVGIGDYAIKKAVFKGNNNEKISGAVTINPENLSVEATETSVTVELPSALDCRLGDIQFPILIAPVTFSKGYTITYTTEAGAELTYSSSESVSGEPGGMIVVGGSTGKESTQLLVCGDSMLYHINADVAVQKGFNSSIIWQWDAKSVMNVIGKDGLRLDDCKPVDNNSKILITSSRGFALLLEKETKEMLWYSNVSTNAHSAELLPNGRVAVACSDNGDCIQIFDLAASNKVLFSAPLTSAHGVLWNEKHQRLYAIGANNLYIYKLTDWETSSPKLTLENTISTYRIVNGTHDLTGVNDDTFLVSGQYSAFYDIQKGTFTQLPRFMNSHSLKAVNYNITTGECWYVDATNPEGEFTWSSKTIHYTDDIQSTSPDKKTISNVPINMYKVRVFNW
jgi:hypothetical protein